MLSQLYRTKTHFWSGRFVKLLNIFARAKYRPVDADSLLPIAKPDGDQEASAKLEQWLHLWRRAVLMRSTL